MQQYLVTDIQLDHLLQLVNMSAPANVVSGMNLYNAIKQHIEMSLKTTIAPQQPAVAAK